MLKKKLFHIREIILMYDELYLQKSEEYYDKREYHRNYRLRNILSILIGRNIYHLFSLYIMKYLFNELVSMLRNFMWTLWSPSRSWRARKLYRGIMSFMVIYRFEIQCSIRHQGNSGLQVDGYRKTSIKKTLVKVLGWTFPTLDNFDSDHSHPKQLPTGKLLPWRISAVKKKRTLDN